MLLIIAQSIHGMNQNNKIDLEEQEANNNDKSNKKQKNLCNAHHDFQIALIRQCSDCCKKFITKNNLDTKIFADETALHYACANGMIDIAELLINKGANLEVIDSIGVTPLAMTIRYKHLPIIKLLIEKKANIRTSDKYENTLLHKACYKHCSSIEIVKLLFEHGVDFNKANGWKRKPLTLPDGSQKFREEVCTYIRSFKHQILTFLLSLNHMKHEKKLFIPKVLQRLILRLSLPLGLHEGTNEIANIEQRITEWTTEDKNNENK